MKPLTTATRQTAEPLSPLQTAKLIELLQYVEHYLPVDTWRDPLNRDFVKAFLWDGAWVELRLSELGWQATANGQPLSRGSAAGLYQVAAWVQRNIADQPNADAAFFAALREQHPDYLAAGLAYEKAHEKREWVVRALETQLATVNPGSLSLQPTRRLALVTEDGRYLAKDGTWTRQAARARLFVSETQARAALRGRPEFYLDNQIACLPLTA